MKKVAAIMIIVLIAIMLLGSNFVYAETTAAAETDNSDSQLIKIKENSAKTLDEYKEKYG